RVEDELGHPDVTDLRGLQLEGGDDADGEAGAPRRPEQVGVLLLARADDAAVGEDHLHRPDVVDRQAVGAAEEADATGGREATDAYAAVVARGDRPAVGLEGGG